MPKLPPNLPLLVNYHDGGLVSVTTGPRREVELVVALDPVWNAGDGTAHRLRFSAIENFDEVATFFGLLTRFGPDVKDAHLDTVLAVVRPNKGVIGIDFAHAGYIELRGAKVTEG